MRTWLLTHKDLLEVVFSLVGLAAGILLGTMAFFVSRAANRISDANLELARRQTQLAELQVRPRFRFVHHGQSSPADLPEAVEIHNDGQPVERIWIEQFAFLELENLQSPHEAPRYLPVYYFGDREYTGNLEGHLGTLSSRWSDPSLPPVGDAKAQLNGLQTALRESSGSTQLRAVRLFLVIGYTDALVDQHSATYEINPAWSFHAASTARRLTPEAGEEVRMLAHRLGPNATPPILPILKESLVNSFVAKLP